MEIGSSAASTNKTVTEYLIFQLESRQIDFRQLSILHLSVKINYQDDIENMMP